jgi:hypothetical protein
MNKYGAWAEWYWQGKTEVLREKPVIVALCSPASEYVPEPWHSYEWIQQAHDTKGLLYHKHYNVAKLKLFSEVSPTIVPRRSKQQQFRFVSTWPTCATVASSCVLSYRTGNKTFLNALCSHIKNLMYLPCFFCNTELITVIKRSDNYTLSHWRHGEGIRQIYLSDLNKSLDFTGQ